MLNTLTSVNNATVEISSLEGPHPRRRAKPHMEVTLATHPEEVLLQDIWDLRQLKADYPKHVKPCDMILDFTSITNLTLRQQIKQYFRLYLPRWECNSFRANFYDLKRILIHLPPHIHMGTITRQHIEEMLPRVYQLGDYAANRGLRVLRNMLEYMTNAPAWGGPHPPRFLIWKEDIPALPHTLPRPIPPDVLEQLDALMEQAIQALGAGQPPPVLTPSHWDAILVLRRTGMRFEDLAHLKAPDKNGHNGCLDQDSEGYWWIRIDHRWTKMNRDHRIPTRVSDGVIDAIHRQGERIKDLADPFGEDFLFRTSTGCLPHSSFAGALKRLSARFTHEGKPYTISPHQFRHTIATDMIEQGVDIYTVKEFLGHKSLAMTERYVKVYLKSLKAKYDAYRLKQQQTPGVATMSHLIPEAQDENKADGGWVEGKVGKLYVSPLPDGIGNCIHLAMLDPCPTPPHCPTCPKLRANKQHLPAWEHKTQNLLITVEALRENPAYARARQKHEQELAHAERVVKMIKEEGFWDGHIHNSKTHEN